MSQTRRWWQRLHPAAEPDASTHDRLDASTRAQRARLDAERWLALREQEVARRLRDRVEAAAGVDPRRTDARVDA